MPATSLSAAVPYSTSQKLVDENIHSLHQLSDLLVIMPSTLYQQQFETQTVGKHVRHVLAHYQTLLAGLEGSVQTGSIDYEQRHRQAALEGEPHVALHTLGTLRAELHAVSSYPIETPIVLHYPVEPSGNSLLPLPSSLGRELAFLTSHTVHHMALIRLLCEAMNMSLPSDFGVHPSTLRFWQQHS
ncbi:hypothetical protein K1Y77_05260 [Halomonas qaidamensis]|uniref:DinB-like domain-containing protein n=1 Tax=Halomonas qaidamensis TaxID=2866211 RepID=A0ABY6JT04_9GAMM|nr:hypothetical protein [Halomonas qaidamensis]UYV20073.1 hypothetical protein K1Y77_05260 [Halomonas qaidamensis]